MSRIASTLEAGDNLFQHKPVLRDDQRRNIKQKGTRISWSMTGKIKRKKPLKKLTDFLLQPEHKFCEICTVRREHGENILIQIATEIHHWAGRIGRLLCYVRYFKASCFGCRKWPHENTVKAREWGLLAPPAQWNVYPE